MSCFICKGKGLGFHKLDGFRIRFMRKAIPYFTDSSLLCDKCFEKFEKIFRGKKKHRISSSSISVGSNVTIKTVSSKSISYEASSKEKSSSDPQIGFDLPTLTSNDSLDSTDRLVHNTADLKSLKDTYNIAQNPEIAVAREAAHPAEQSAIRRKGTRIIGDPNTPSGRGGRDFPEVAEDDDEDVISSRAPSDLSLVQPIVRKRQQPVVHLNQDIMDIYLANTSGG